MISLGVISIPPFFSYTYNPSIVASTQLHFVGSIGFLTHILLGFSKYNIPRVTPLYPTSTHTLSSDNLWMSYVKMSIVECIKFIYKINIYPHDIVSVWKTFLLKIWKCHSVSWGLHGGQSLFPFLGVITQTFSPTFYHRYWVPDSVNPTFFPLTLSVGPYFYYIHFPAKKVRVKWNAVGWTKFTFSRTEGTLEPHFFNEKLFYGPIYSNEKMTKSD